MHANAWFLYNLLPSTKHVWSLKKVQQFSQYLASMLRVSQHLRSCCRFKTRVPSMDLHDLYTKSCCEKIASRWSGYFQYSQNPVWLNPHLTWRCIKKYGGFFIPQFHPPDLRQHRWFYGRFPLWSPTPKWIEMESSCLDQAGNTWDRSFYEYVGVGARIFLENALEAF